MIPRSGPAESCMVALDRRKWARECTNLVMSCTIPNHQKRDVDLKMVLTALLCPVMGEVWLPATTYIMSIGGTMHTRNFRVRAQ